MGSLLICVTFLSQSEFRQGSDDRSDRDVDFGKGLGYRHTYLQCRSVAPNSRGSEDGSGWDFGSAESRSRVNVGWAMHVVLRFLGAFGIWGRVQMMGQTETLALVRV